MMWIIMMDLRDFTRGTGPLRAGMDVINAVERIAKYGKEMTKLVNQVSQGVTESLTRSDLVAYINQIISPISPVSPKTIVELEEIVRLQATALDKIVIESEYINVPKVFKQVEMKFIEILKVYLWPYYTPSYSTV